MAALSDRPPVHCIRAGSWGEYDCLSDLTAMVPLLLHRVASGEALAVRECLDRFGGLVWSLARRYSPSTEEAEDAVQEVFLDLWRSAARFDPRIASETTFVAMIARRRLIDRQKRRQRRRDTEPLPEAAAAPAGTDLAPDLSAEAALAARALDQLRPEQRQVLMLAAYHGMSHDEIARMTGMPLGTVKTHARRGLMRVREVLTGGEATRTATAVANGGAS